MRAWLQVVWREWTECRLLVVGAFLLGWFPWAAPLLPGTDHLAPSDLRQAAAILILVLVTIGGVALFAPALLARDLTNRRLSFFLTRPLSAATLWSARVVATLSILIAILILASLPTVITERDALNNLDISTDQSAAPLSALGEFYSLRSSPDSPRALPIPLLVLAVVLALLSALLVIHWLNVVIRSRSPWLLMDIITFALLGAALWTLRDRLLSLQAYGAMVWIERVWWIGLPLVLFWAGLRQVEVGRIDPLRSHRVFSSNAWSGLAVLTLATALYGLWITNGTVADLKSVIAVSPNPTGSHMVIGGTLRGRAGLQGTFVVPLGEEDGQGTAFSAGSAIPSLFHWKWSGDGSRAVWARCKRLVPALCEVWTQDLAAGTEPRSTGIPIRSNYIRLALSHGGQLIALGDNNGVEVYATASGELIAAARTPEVLDLDFLSSRRVRVLHFGEDGDLSRQVIRILDIDTKKNQVVGRIPGDVYGRFYTISPDGSLFLFNSVVPRRLQLRDSLSGEVVSDLIDLLELDNEDLLVDAQFVTEDKLGVIWTPRPRTSLADHPIRTFKVILLGLPSDSRDRPEVLSQVRVEAVRDVQIGAQLEPGVLTVLVNQGSPSETPTDPLLAEAGLKPLPSSTTYLLHPGRQDLEVSAHGYIPISVHRRTGIHHSHQATLFAAGHQALFTIEHGRANVVFAGTEHEGSKPESTRDFLSLHF